MCGFTAERKWTKYIVLSVRILFTIVLYILIVGITIVILEFTNLFWHIIHRGGGFLVFYVKKLQHYYVFYILLGMLVISTLTISFGVKAVMSSPYRDPITGIKTQDRKVALSVNVYENTDIDYLLEAFGDAKVTFFVSEAFESLRGVKVSQIAALGHEVGILEDGMRGKTRKEVNDRLAERVERISFLTGKPCDLVRFNNNSFDDNCVDAVFTLGLYPVQWATDDTAENFSSGDIILVTGESEVEGFIKKITADGYELSTVGGIILRNNYVIDLGGEQRKR